MANSSYIDKAKAGASKTMLKELPRILWESAAIGENKYKYIKPDGEELTIEMNDTDAKSLAYAATKMAERLIELSNKTDGFFGPAIENVEGKSYENAWLHYAALDGQRKRSLLGCGPVGHYSTGIRVGSNA